MKKKIVVLVVVALMACSFCGGLGSIDYFPHSREGLKRVVESSSILSGGTTPDDGIPGGPPGNPG